MTPVLLLQNSLDEINHMRLGLAHLTNERQEWVFLQKEIGVEFPKTFPLLKDLGIHQSRIDFHFSGFINPHKINRF